MTTQHTPGPWTIKFFRSIEPNHALICAEDWHDFASVVVRFCGDDTDDATGLANARLIAAAPEMLEALKEAKNGLRYWEPQTAHGASEMARICALVDAAIAKAKGN